MGGFHESSCKEKTQDLCILLPLRVRSMITPVKFIRLTSQLLWGSWFEDACQYCKYCKCSHNSFQMKCLDHSCSYRQLNLPQMPDFENVHFLPDSVDIRTWAKYMWWVQTLSAPARNWQTRRCRALTPAGGWTCSWLCSVQKMMQHPSFLQVRNMKWRSCGMLLFPLKHPLQDSVVVRNVLICLPEKLL